MFHAGDQIVHPRTSATAVFVRYLTKAEAKQAQAGDDCVVRGATSGVQWRSNSRNWRLQ